MKRRVFLKLIAGSAAVSPLIVKAAVSSPPDSGFTVYEEEFQTAAVDSLQQNPDPFTRRIEGEYAFNVTIAGFDYLT